VRPRNVVSDSTLGKRVTATILVDKLGMQNGTRVRVLLDGQSFGIKGETDAGWAIANVMSPGGAEPCTCNGAFEIY